MCARFGRSRRCVICKTYKYSMQRSAVNQRSTQCRGYPVSRSIMAQPIVVRKTFLYFDVLKLARVFSFQNVNREKRRFFGKNRAILCIYVLEFIKNRRF